MTTLTFRSNFDMTTLTFLLYRCRHAQTVTGQLNYHPYCYYCNKKQFNASSIEGIYQHCLSKLRGKGIIIMLFRMEHFCDYCHKLSCSKSMIYFVCIKHLFHEWRIICELYTEQQWNFQLLPRLQYWWWKQNSSRVSLFNTHACNIA